MGQLKISDLSVGDWVLNRQGVPTKVQVVVSEGNMRCGEDAKPEHSVHIWVSDVEPIPITPEMLEKNGWKYETYTIEDINGYDIEYKCYRHTFYRDSYRYDTVLEDSYGGYYQCTIESSIPDEDGELRFISVLCSLDFVEYLHQLQHALRLAGVEKEIEL